MNGFYIKFLLKLKLKNVDGTFWIQDWQGALHFDFCYVLFKDWRAVKTGPKRSPSTLPKTERIKRAW